MDKPIPDMNPVQLDGWAEKLAEAHATHRKLLEYDGKPYELAEHNLFNLLDRPRARWASYMTRGEGC